jgi:hypothetical protein
LPPNTITGRAASPQNSARIAQAATMGASTRQCPRVGSATNATTAMANMASGVISPR